MTRVVALVASAGIIAAGAAAPAPAPGCGGALVTDVRDGRPVCLHASEVAPPGVDLEDRPSVDELEERRFGETRVAPALEPEPVPQDLDATPGVVAACIDDGVSGDRIQLIYARASSAPDRYSSMLGLLRRYAADADYSISLSASVAGQGRRIRYVTDASCAVDVDRVTLTSAGLQSFSTMRSELRAAGYTRTDRHYLVWVDAATGMCGLGEMYNDDRPGVDNPHNNGPMYARVDAPCFGYAEAHEILHTLGAVQDSAPHSTGAGHCTDETDGLCYVDSSKVPMDSVCTGAPTWQVDCRQDDYFNAAPASGSYLATRWNVARSTFLQPAEPPPPPPAISTSVPTSSYAGLAVPVAATATVPAGRTWTIRWSDSRSDCSFFASSGARNTFYCRATAATGVQVTATVTDSLGLSSAVTRTMRLVVPSSRQRTTQSLVSSATRVRSGTLIQLRGTLRGASTSRRVIGMPVALWRLTSGTTRWVKVTTRTSDRLGNVVVATRPTRTTAYIFVSGYTRTWGPDQSNVVRVLVT